MKLSTQKRIKLVEEQNKRKRDSSNAKESLEKEVFSPQKYFLKISFLQKYLLFMKVRIV